MSRLLFIFAALFFSLSSFPETPAWAVQPDEMLADPAMELRAREISKGLRCLVCQNENIDDSNADLARDLRLVVRERLLTGESNNEVIAFIHARYGDFVLLKPPLRGGTILLWAGPFLFLLAGAFFLLRTLRTKKEGAEAAPLSREEKKKLEEILQRKDS